MDLERLKTLCDGADEGPWEYRAYPETQICHHVVQLKHRGGTYTICTPVHANISTQRNMEFIAAAREAMPQLIQRLLDLEGKLARAGKVVEAANVLARTVPMSFPLNDHWHDLMGVLHAYDAAPTKESRG